MKKLIDTLIGWSVVALMVFTVGVVCWQVISRSVFSAPSSITEEVARFSLIWMGMLAAVYTYSQKMHVGVDIVTHALSAGLRRTIELGIWTVCGAFSAIVLVFGGLRLMEITYTLGQRSSVLDAPMHLVYAIVPLCGALMTIYSVFFIGETLRGKANEPEHTPISGV